MLVSLLAAAVAPAAQSSPLKGLAGSHVDATLRVEGVPDPLLLVRASGTAAGITDEIVAIREGRFESVPLVGGPYGGLVTAIVGRSYFDVDCGPASGTLVQLELEPLGIRWRQTRHTFVLRNGRFVLANVTSRVIASADVIRRRCMILRW